jgi:hypothetical protein
MVCQAYKLATFPRRLGPMAGWGEGHSRLRRLTGMF